MDMAPVAWHVIGSDIRQTTTLGNGGSGIVDVWEVPYVIDSGPAAGHHGTVTIPHGQYTPERVQAAITDAVSTTHGVADLKVAGA
jgi:hypothetical protein